MNRHCGDELPKVFFRKEGKMEKILLALLGDKWVFSLAEKSGDVAKVVTMFLAVLVLKITVMVVIPMVAGCVFLAFLAVGANEPRVFLVVLVWAIFFVGRHLLIHAFRA